MLKHGRPLGFKSNDLLQNFTEKLHKPLRSLAPGTQIGIRGSAVTGRSFNKRKKDYTGAFFDMKTKEASDLDIALVGERLFARAKEKGIPIRGGRGGQRTQPLTENDLKALGLFKTHEQLTTLMEGRDVRYMIYDSMSTLRSRGNSMTLR